MAALEQLVGLHPLQERLWALLARALYRSASAGLALLPPRNQVGALQIRASFDDRDVHRAEVFPTDDLLPSITTPALILQSTEDHVVPPENGPHILEKLGGEDKELVWLENSYHVATLDNDADLIAERSVRFIREHGG